MKKYSIAILVAALIALTASSAVAATYTDPYNPSDVYLSSSSGQLHSVTFEHNILDDGFPHPLEYVTSATLAITLYDDGYFGPDYSNEYVAVITVDNNATWGTWEVGGWVWGYETTTGEVTASLLADGKLGVTITATSGDFYFDKSVLCVNTAYGQVPVPGAVLLGMLGLSVAGARLRKNR